MNCLQKALAMRFWSESSFWLKVLDWFGGIRGFFPVIVPMRGRSPSSLDLKIVYEKKVLFHHEFTRMLCYLGDVPTHIIAAELEFFSFKLAPW